MYKPIKLNYMKEITINIPFTYSLDDEGYWTNKTLKTIDDMKDEVRAELENGAINSANVHMEVKHARELNIYAERVQEMLDYMKNLGLEWKPEYFNVKDYSPVFDDPEDERIFNIKLGELLMLREILGL